MRIVTYSHDSFGLGHLRRTLAIGRFLAREIPEASVLSLIGSTMAQMYFDQESPNHDYLKLPTVTKTGADEYAARHLHLPLADVLKLRRSLVFAALDEFPPDLLLIDKSPRGIGDELVEPLEWLRREKPGCRVVLGLRDILDDPAVVQMQWHTPGFSRWIQSIYDEIWIWGEQRVYDTLHEYNFPLEIREISRYLGYLPIEPVCSDYGRLRAKAGVTEAGQKLLLMTAGGGGDAYPIYEQFIAGFRDAAAPSVRVMAVAGPLMSEHEFAALREAFRPVHDRVRLVRFLTHFEDWMRASDAIICMGGYNTLREIASIGKPTLVVPRTYPRREQEIRAGVFASRGWCHTLGPDEAVSSAVRRFCDRLQNDDLAHSLTTLPCRGFESLREEFHRLFADPAPGQNG